MSRLLLLCCTFSFIGTISAQQVIIPGFTGYAVPAENDEAHLFAEKTGLQHWKETTQHIQFFFHLRTPGMLAISLLAKNNTAGGKIKMSVGGKDFTVGIPSGSSFKNVPVGAVLMKDTGYYTIDLSSIKKTGNTIADIQHIDLSGPAAAGVHANLKARRNAASVHLHYPLPDTIHAIAFYNEVTIPEGKDLLHTFYMACGFARGYFGLEVNSESERRVVFSVWDAGHEATDRNKVPDSNKVKLLAKGDAVYTGDFGYEGTGGQSHWAYLWKPGTYKLLVTALPDSASRTTIYTAYFFVPEVQKWKLIASYRAPGDGGYLRNLYSFNENFWPVNGQLQRKALYGNQWVQRDNGQWIELIQSKFSYDATARAGDRTDYGAGVAEDQFYLWNGGFQTANIHEGDVLNRPAAKRKPAIDWTKNADSARQAESDKQEILLAVQSKKMDTTGSKDGVYYQVLKEGTGDYVSVEDTVTVFYKGSLLKDGSIFDQTKDKPATFPLKRLIKGWQVAVPMCRIGGKIRIIIPSGQAYTIRSRSKDIPPNSVLVFDIEVVSVKKT